MLPTDTVCWHCGREVTPTKTVSTQEKPEAGSTAAPENDEPISITAVSIFALITLVTIVLFIVVTNVLAHYPPG